MRVKYYHYFILTWAIGWTSYVNLSGDGFGYGFSGCSSRDLTLKNNIFLESLVCFILSGFALYSICKLPNVKGL